VNLLFHGSEIFCKNYRVQIKKETVDFVMNEKSVCVVRGAWCVVRGAWCVVRGAWCVMVMRCVMRCVMRGAT
jgi:hypothetical protein